MTFNNGVLFRTRNFTPDYRYTLNFVDAWSIDEIIILDISRHASKDRDLFYAAIEKFAENCFVPLAVGGGVCSVHDFNQMLGLGADKVVINTRAVEEPELIARAAKRYGSQCVVVSIDVRQTGRGGYEVFTRCGEKPTGLDPTAWARRVEDLGAGEIMLTSINKDGTLEGYDNTLNAMVAEAVSIPVLVSGGAGKWQDFVDGITIGKASAVCTTNIYHFTKTSIASAKQYMKARGVDVRI